MKLTKVLLALVLTVTLTVAGCTAAEIIADINLIATLATSVGGIVGQFSGDPLVSSDTALVGKFQAVLDKTVADAEANRTKGSSELLAVMQAAETNIPAFFATANFQNQKLETEIVNAGNDVLSIVEVIAAYSGSKKAPPPIIQAKSMRMPSGRIMTIPPRVRISHAALRSQIVTHWNSQVCSGASECLIR